MKFKSNLINGILHGILAAVFITIPIGSVYAFSAFSSDIASKIGCSLGQIQFAFTLSIFFLGMGAAFFGTLVEKNIKASALVSATLFLSGLLITSFGIINDSLSLIYLGYGFCNGLAQGIGYLTPVKTLILWFKKNKGLASAISIISFGLGSSFCVYLSKLILPIVGIDYLFAVLASIYFPMMLVGTLLIKKPAYAIEEQKKTKDTFTYKSMLKNRYFWQSWLFMFLNIACGLVLIGASKNIFQEVNISAETIVVLLMLCGLFNGGFRLVFAWISDFLKNRIDAWLLISGISVILMLISSVHYPFIAGAILCINACYGGGFSCCPSILSDHYGNNSLSRIHGAVLSAWGFAALPAFVLNYFIFSNMSGFHIATTILTIVYFINFINVMFLKQVKQKSF